jgi:hypothetical protein
LNVKRTNSDYADDDEFEKHSYKKHKLEEEKAALQAELAGLE